MINYYSVISIVLITYRYNNSISVPVYITLPINKYKKYSNDSCRDTYKYDVETIFIVPITYKI